MKCVLPEFLENEFRTNGAKLKKKDRKFLRGGGKTTRNIQSRYNDCVISNSSGKKNRITARRVTKCPEFVY